MRRQLFTAAFSAAVAVASSAFAGFTQVGATPKFEHSHERILQTLYGGDFHRIGTDFFNGSVTVRRVDDGMTSVSPMSMFTGTIGDTTDETWTGALFKAKAIAKFSDNSQNLAITNGKSTHHLFSAHGYGYNVTGEATFDASSMGETWFIRSGDSGMHSSRTADNADGRDHMITYEVLGIGGPNEKVWVMFWEDLTRTPGLSNKRTHSDYNDLVVEMRAMPVPLPAAAWAAIALGGGALAMRKRIRRIAGA